MNKHPLYLFFILSIISQLANAQAYSTTDSHMDFRTLLGLPGSCFLDPATANVFSISGGLCPSSGTKEGVVGVYHIFASPNDIIRLKVKSETIPADNLVYTPAGFYTVSGFADVPINPDSFTDIDTGPSGVIRITLGGTLTSSVAFPNPFAFSYIIREAIEWNVLP